MSNDFRALIAILEEAEAVKCREDVLLDKGKELDEEDDSDGGDDDSEEVEESLALATRPAREIDSVLGNANEFQGRQREVVLRRFIRLLMLNGFAISSEAGAIAPKTLELYIARAVKDIS